ncbi:MAG: hypothetical protein M3R58_06085 [Pseudomonadota bacterium]|nr:hypothetical protein [Pseudomonadota bacterium]
MTDGLALRRFDVYLGGISPSIEGGQLVESDAVTLNGSLISMGRWSNASIGFFGQGSGSPFPGSIHFINAPSGYPTYLADVLTGTVTYSLARATSPTNQNNLAGTLGSMTLGVNFTNRTLDFDAAVSVPGGNGGAGGSWNMSAANVPISLNTFTGSTNDRLTITNGAGQSSGSNSRLTGSFAGSFVGTGIGAAIVGYGISDTTGGNSSDWNIVAGWPPWWRQTGRRCPVP